MLYCRDYGSRNQDRAEVRGLALSTGAIAFCTRMCTMGDMNTTFTKVPKTLGVSGFRANLARNLARAKKSPLIISDRKGGESYVVLGADAYNELMELWEDEQDGLELARLIRANKGKKLIPWEKVRDSVRR
jgi:PHD/YefM family antitoxin component YafN of YafNO toxin-antitoxin module